VAHAFREKALARWEPEFIGPIVDELIDRFIADGEADLVRQLTFEFPVRVIARLLGLPEEDFAQFQRWSVELISLGPTSIAALPRPRRCATTSPTWWPNGGQPRGRRHQRPGDGGDRRREA
jgi:cytochrome P450